MESASFGYSGVTGAQGRKLIRSYGKSSLGCFSDHISSNQSYSLGDVRIISLSALELFHIQRSLIAGVSWHVSKGLGHSNPAILRIRKFGVLGIFQALLSFKSVSLAFNPSSTQDIILYLHKIFHSNTKSFLSFFQTHSTLIPADKILFLQNLTQTYNI